MCETLQSTKQLVISFQLDKRALQTLPEPVVPLKDELFFSQHTQMLSVDTLDNKVTVMKGLPDDWEEEEEEEMERDEDENERLVMNMVDLCLSFVGSYQFSYSVLLFKFYRRFSMRNSMYTQETWDLWRDFWE